MKIISNKTFKLFIDFPLLPTAHREERTVILFIFELKY